MPAPAGSTLSEVARLAGVSRMTVSRVLRNAGYASPDARAKVEEAVRRLGYRPNPMVSAFMSYVRSGAVKQNAGVLAYLTSSHEGLDWRRNGTYRRFYEGAEQRAEELGYRLEEFRLREPGINASRLSGILYARGIGGLIIAPMSTPHAHLNLDWEKFAAVALGYSLLKPALSRVCNDQFATLLIAMRELWRLGYRRIGLAMPYDDDARVHYHWSAACLSFCHRHPKAKFPPPHLPRQWKFDRAAEWIRRHRVEAVVSPHATLIDALRKRGFRIPEEVAVASLDWSEELPPCAGVNQNPREIGEAAVDLVAEQLNHNRFGIPARQRTLNMPGVWVPGPTVCRQLRAV